MKPSSSSLSLLSCLTLVHALNVPSPKLAKRLDFTVNKPNVLASSDGEANGSDLTTVRDMIYFADITLGGVDYKVQLDTGSADLWIKGKSSPLPGATETGLTANLTYGIGYAYGNVATADVTFAGITIQNQAFIDVSDANNPTLGYSANGILGLGFTSLSSVDYKLNATGKSSGRTLLYNTFLENPKEPNFITFALQRSTDPDEDVKGVFTIGEINPKYANIAKSDPVPTWPVVGTKRWTVLLDAVLVGSSTTLTPTTIVPGVPTNQAVILLDTGTSYTYAPPEVCKAIYGSIPGAQLDSTTGLYTIPCSSEVDIALQIGGQVFPVHPLDLTMSSTSDPNTCYGTFVSQQITVGAGEFDWIVGANFLRSVYSMYDFGDFDSSGKMGNPYLKLLSLIDPDDASKEFHSVRGGDARKGIEYQPVNAAGSSSGGTTTITLGSNVANTLDKVGKYFPAMLGVMALNAIVLLALVVVGIMFLMKQRKKSGGRRRQLPGRMSPMPLGAMNSTYSELGGPSQLPHSYQPVSMALTEDTFVPPSPAFRKDGFDGNTLKSGDRPNSIA